MAGDRSPQPPKETWEAWKQEIHNWYLTHNWTCQDIQKALEQHDFRVSQRQIKNRLSEWKFERKKTPYTYYLAMSIVSDYCRSRNIEIEFEVPKRETRVSYSSQKVKKECERVKKRYDSRAEILIWPSFQDACCMLGKADITWRITELAAHHTLLTSFPPKNALACWDGHSHDLPFHNHPSTGEEDNVASNVCSSSPVQTLGQKDHFVTSELSADALSDCRSLSACQISPMLENRPSTYTLRSANTPRSPCLFKEELSSPTCRRSPISDVFDSDVKCAFTSGTIQSVDRGTSLQKRMPRSFLEAESTKHSPIKADQHFVTDCSCSMNEIPALKASGIVRRSNSSFSTYHHREPPLSNSSSDSHGATHPLEVQCSTIKHESFDWSFPLNNHSFDQNICTEGHKLTASRWAAPYYMQCISNVPEDALQRTKERSMEALRHALDHKNEPILPCLSWTILILGQAERTQQLAEFLDASCKVIDKQQNIRNSFTYAIPFRYALAWANNNDQAMDDAGDSLACSYDQIRMIWGKDHPNFLVSAYIYAWHLLRHANYAKAIELLAEHLPVCEAKMGSHDLLTISCLTVVSRAHEEMSNPLEAIHYLRMAMTATQLLEEDPDIYRPVLQRFRLSLLARHAALLFSVHDCLNAEKQFRRVLQLRGKLYGLNDVTTLNAAHDVGSVLQSMGQGALWKDLVDYMQKGNHWEQVRDWCKWMGKKPPPPPAEPPSW